MSKLKALFAAIFKKIKLLCTKIWHFIKKKPVISGIIAAVLIAAIAASGIFITRPPKITPADPNLVGYSVSSLSPAPVYTDGDGIASLGAPSKLEVYFEQDISFASEQDNENLKDVQITPAVAGNWAWASTRRLVFTPEKEWTAGQKYKVKLPRAIINTSQTQNPLRLKEYEFTFSAPAFSADINSFILYQDPKDPKIYKALAQISFTYPVNADDFEKAVTLKLDGARLEYSIVYDRVFRKATVTSVPIKILGRPQLSNLAIAKFNNASASESALDIPSSDKFFRYDGASSSIVRNEKDEPEQILMVNFTDGITGDNIKGKVRAWLLPKINTQKRNRKPADLQADDKCALNTPCECAEDDSQCDCTPGQNVCRRLVPHGRYSNYDNWVPADITPEVLASLKEIKLESVPTSALYDKLHSFKYDADTNENTEMYVKVDAPLLSSSGFKIKDSYSSIVKIPSYPKEVKIVGSGSIIALSGSKRLSFVSRGVEGIKVEMGRVLPGQINHLVSQTSGNFESPHFKGYYFDENNITESFEEVIPLVKENKQANYSSVNLASYLTPGKTGLFFVKSYGYDPKKQRKLTSEFKRFLLVTDLGLLAKKDIEDKTRVYVMSVSNGTPVSGAKVEVLGKNGIPLFTKHTGEQGYVDFPPLSGFSREKQPVAFVAALGADISFLPVDSYDRSVNYSRFDTEGVRYSSLQNKGLNAFLFTDRGIYRPGDGVNIGAIVKTPQWGALSGVPVKLNVINARGKNIYSKMVSLNADGFIDFNVETQTTSPTGTYEAYLYDVTRERSPVQLGSVNFKVEEFQEDKLRITAQLSGSDRKGWQPLEGLNAKVKLENLFGTAAQGNRIKMNLTLNPLKFNFAQYRGYTFDDPYRNAKNAAPQSATEKLPDAQTGEDGVVNHEINLSKYAGGSYRMVLNAEGFEKESGSSVAASDFMLVSPNRYLVGYKSASKLSYLQRNSKAAIEFIAVDPDLNKIALNNMKIKLIRMQHVSALVKEYNNTYKYQSVVKEQEVETKNFAISEKGYNYDISTAQPGRYALDVYDEFNQKLSRVLFFVAGSANLTYSLEKDAELQLTLENEEIEPGGELVVNIIAPYAGSGLITIEREKVFAQKWFTSASNSSQQRIRVPADFEGNGYINVSFIRGIDSKEIFASPHSYAVLPFYVKRNKRDVKINLDAAQLVKPGEELHIKYSADKNAKIVIYGVNEGILQVAGYSLPKPLNHFFKKMALEVRTRQTVDLILPDFKMVKDYSATGGDDDFYRSELAAGLNPFARKRDKPVVFWSGVLTASAEERTYVYKVPSYFNGEIRIMAVAASHEAAGSASVSATVRAPIILMPAQPYMAVPGDEFDANVRVSNNKKDSADGIIEVGLSVSNHLEVIGSAKQTVTVPYGKEELVKFKVKALDNPGGASIKYTAVHLNPKDIITAESTLSVRPATTYVTSLTTNNVNKSKFDIEGFYRDMYDYAAERNIYISNSPLVLAKGLASYFNKYPHGCSEQITSRVFPFLSLAALGGDNSVMNRKEVEELFNGVQERLKRRQLNYGGFGAWDTSASEDKYITLYIMHFLTEAKDLDYNADRDIIAQGLKRLDDYASKYPVSETDAFDIAFANYLLARNGKVVTNYLLRTEDYLNKNVKGWEETLTGAYIAATYALLKNDGKALNLIKRFKPEGEKYLFYSDYDSSSIRNAKYMYLIGRHFPQLLGKNSAIVKSLVNAVIENNYNTMSSAATIMALAAYSQAVAENDGTIKITAFDGAAQKDLPLKQDGFPKADIGQDIKKLEVNVQTIGPLGVYYIATVQGFNKKPDTASQAKGLDIVREYLDETGKPVKEAAVGQDITVSIKIKTSGDKQTVTNIALTDLLPGGFEIVSGSFAGSVDFYDAREDRMLIYLTANRDIKELRYKVKVIASGKFTVPMLHAASLYDNDVYGYAKAGEMLITPAN